MQHQHSIRGMTGSITLQRARSRMAQFEFWKRFAGSEFEIFWNTVGLLLRR
jgi:hypothetical protein